MFSFTEIRFDLARHLLYFYNKDLNRFCDMNINNSVSLDVEFLQRWVRIVNLMTEKLHSVKQRDMTYRSAGAPVGMWTCGHVHTKFWQPP